MRDDRAGNDDACGTPTAYLLSFIFKIFFALASVSFGMFLAAAAAVSEGPLSGILMMVGSSIGSHLPAEPANEGGQ